MNILTHLSPNLDDIKRNKVKEPDGERLRSELIEWLDKNKIVTILLDTPNHQVDINIVKLPSYIKPVLTIWGSIFVVDESK